MENAEEGQKDQGRAGRVPGGCPGRLEPTELVCLSQVFKFIYCCRLAEMGLATQAFHYCEAIAKSVLAEPRRHSPVLLRQLAQVTPPAAQGPGAAAARSDLPTGVGPARSWAGAGVCTAAEGPWELWREKGLLAGGPRPRAPQPCWAGSWLWPHSPNLLLHETESP